MATIDVESADRDERLGEAIEEFLALVEAGGEPDPEEFAGKYPDLGDDLKEALEGLSLVRGLVGSANGRRLERGRRLAGYRIVGELGAGGMGVVYEAVHVDLDRPVALKVLDSRATRDGNGLRRFLNEAKTAAGLHHTHIVPVFDVGHVGGLLYYAMQRIEGSGLDRVVKALRRDRSTGAGSGSGRRLSAVRPAESELDLSGLAPGGGVSWAGATAPEGTHPSDTPPPYEPPRGSGYYRWVAEVGRQAAQALAYAHRRGVVHRDIKPSNLLVDGRGNVWVADFGLARRQTDPNLTHSEALIGTPRYMSPEQSRSAPVDARTDVYSLGATLYELLTLRPPFEGKTTAELIEQIGQRDPVPPRRADSRIPRDLETIVLKALAKRPSDRYAGAAELADDLQRFLGHEPVRARRIGPLGRLVRLARRHPAITAVSTAAAALVLATATVAYVRVVQERDRALAAEQLTQAELRRRLLSEATLLRHSSVANRRERGLALLSEAAQLRPDAELRGRLRDEAVAFLALRDVEKRPAIPTGRPRGLAFAGADRLAMVAEDDESFALWSLADGRQLGQPPPTGPPRERGEGRPADRGDPRRAGRRIAVAGTLGAVVWPDGHGIRLFNPGTGSPSGDLPMTGRDVQALYAVEMPAGARLITVDRPAPPEEPSPTDATERRNGPRDREPGPPPARVALWDPLRPEAPLAELTAPHPEDAPPLFPLVAYSPDGPTIATAWFQGTTVALWSAVDGQSRGEIDARSPLRSLAMGPYGQLAAAGVGAIRLWDVNTQLPLSMLTPHQARPMIRFSPDGRVLAVAGYDSADIELWDPAGNVQIAALTTEDPVFGDLAFSPDGGTIVAAQPSSLAVWELVDSAVRRRASGLERTPWSLAFAPDGCLAIAFRGEAPAQLWHPVRCPTTAQTIDGARPVATMFDAWGRLVAPTGDRLILAADHDRPGPTIAIDLPDPARPDPFADQPLAPPWLRVQATTSSRDGRYLAMLRTHEVLIWDATAPDLFRAIELPTSSDMDPSRRVPPPRPAKGKREEGSRPGARGSGGRAPWRSAAIDPSARRLYALTWWADELYAWSLDDTTARPLSWASPSAQRRDNAAKDADPRPRAPTVLALSPDGTTLAVGRRDGGVLLLDTRTGTVRDEVALPRGQEGEASVSSLCFAPHDASLLAVGTDSGVVRLCRLTLASDVTVELPLTLPIRPGSIGALAFDGSGRQLAAAGEDKAVEVWDLQQLDRELGRLGLPW